jgi:hypothetical protein
MGRGDRVSSVRLRDGSVGWYQRRPDDCWSAAVASCLRLPLDAVPDLRLDQRLEQGMGAADVDRVAQGAVKKWLAARALTIVTYDRVPVDPPRRWVGIIPLGDWWVSHCVLMRYGEILFDPSPLAPPLAVVQAALITGVSIRRRIWRADEVTEGFSFAKCPAKKE